MDVGIGKIDRTDRCDVLVIGSGVSGICAAIQAGRCGCRTVLLEKDEVLGGNSGPNLGVGITGADRYSAYATETGLIQELQEAAAWVSGFTPVARHTMPYNISRRNEAVTQEWLEKAGVQVRKRHYARMPLTEGRRITAVIAEDLAAFQTTRIEVAHVVIEASGDGEIGARAGADFDVGSEAQSEYGERSAPPRRTRTVQGTSLVAIACQTDRDIVFEPPAGTPRFLPRTWQESLGSFLRHHDGFFTPDRRLLFLYVTEAGGDMDTIRDDGAIYETLLKQLWSEWDHIKNGPHRDQTRSWDLLWVSPKAGKRESRRFLGDYVLTQTDLEDGRLFPDDIAYGGHDLDDHQPLRGFANIQAHSVPPLYGIPYRSCYSRNMENLLLAGRLISATHLAHSSTRIMRTGGAVGQAVGLAAALCCRYQCSPRSVGQNHMDELQSKLLLADATLLPRPVPAQDDLARSAAATATSELRFNDQPPGDFLPLLAPAGLLLWDWPPRIDAVELYLRNVTPADTTLSLSVLRATLARRWKTMEEYHACGRNDLRAEAFHTLASFTSTIPAGFSGWHRLAFPEPIQTGPKSPVCDDDRLLLALGRSDALEWALSRRAWEIAELVEYLPHPAAWSALGVMGALRVHPPPPLGEASQVLGGFHRRFSRAPTNQWISDPEQGMPQSLTLSWAAPQTANEVVLVFDNIPRHRHENPWESGERVLGQCVQSYAIEIRREGRWLTIAREHANHHRCRTHSFDTSRIDALRLTILSTHGSGHPARVYQVRVYHR